MRELGNITGARYPLQAEIASGWVNFNGSGSVAIFSSFNVSSVADNNPGDWTVTWEQAFTSTAYALSLMGRYDGSTATGALAIKTGTVPTPTAVTIVAAEGSGDTSAVDLRHACVIAYGEGGEQQPPGEERLISSWAQWTPTGALQDSENVSSMTDTGAGDWTMNFIIPYASEAHYVTGGMTQGATISYLGLKRNVAMLAGSVTFWTGSSTGNQVDPTLACAAVLGYY